MDAIWGVKATQFHLHPDGYMAHCSVLGIPSIEQYVNAGVLLLNLAAMRGERLVDIFEELLERNFPVQDQDIFNVACYNHILLLPPKFNLMITQSINYKDMAKVFGNDMTEEAFEKPVVIHYAGKIKPWRSVNIEFAEKWWPVCADTCLFESAIKTLCATEKKEYMSMKNSMEFKILK